MRLSVKRLGFLRFFDWIGFNVRHSTPRSAGSSLIGANIG